MTVTPETQDGVSVFLMFVGLERIAGGPAAPVASAVLVALVSLLPCCPCDPAVPVTLLSL